MFSRRWIINFLLIVLIIVFTYIGNRYDVKTGYQPDRNISRLTPDKVNSILVQTADETLELERSNGDWHIIRPLQWPANAVNIHRLLGITESQTSSRLESDALDLNKLGLGLPKALLQLNDTTILFGGNNNIGDRRYIQIDNMVYLLEDIHLPFISQGLNALIDRRLLPAMLDPTALDLGNQSFEQDDSDLWQSVADSNVTSEQINELVNSWTRLEASRISRFNAADTPRKKISARLRDGRQIEFYLMSIAPQIIIANPHTGLQYHFSKDFYYQLLDIRDAQDGTG